LKEEEIMSSIEIIRVGNSSIEDLVKATINKGIPLSLNKRNTFIRKENVPGVGRSYSLESLGNLLIKNDDVFLYSANAGDRFSVNLDGEVEGVIELNRYAACIECSEVSHTSKGGEEKLLLPNRLAETLFGSYYKPGPGIAGKNVWIISRELTFPGRESWLVKYLLTPNEGNRGCGETAAMVKSLFESLGANVNYVFGVEDFP
jgi:hypothetical protein